MVLICQLCPVGAVFSNTTVTASPTDTNTDSRATHTATNGVGDTEYCVGPTPPTGLSFPTKTFIEVLAIVSGPTTTKYDFETGGGAYVHVPFTATGPTTLWTTYSRADYPQSSHIRIAHHVVDNARCTSQELTSITGQYLEPTPRV